MKKEREVVVSTTTLWFCHLVAEEHDLMCADCWPPAAKPTHVPVHAASAQWAEPLPVRLVVVRIVVAAASVRHHMLHL